MTGTPFQKIQRAKEARRFGQDLRRVSDLLSDEEKAKLQADLTEMAACRRRAWGAAAGLVIG